MSFLKLFLKNKTGLVLVLNLVVIFAVFITIWVTDTGIKSKVLGLSTSGNNIVQIEGINYSESKIYSTDFEFNAIAPTWTEEDKSITHKEFQIRTSKDDVTWNNWVNLDAIRSQNERDKNKNGMYSETPLFEVGKYFQYRVEVTKDISGVVKPVDNFKINYYDTRPTLKQKIGESLSSIFRVSADSSPTIISRQDWGSADPNGDLYKNDPDHYWPPVTVSVNQLFVHHTVDSDNSSDFASVVRAIWQYHAVTLGWGDIGYNYLIDSSGNIFEGRFGGDGVVAGHTLNYNTGSLGVALIGCYQSNNSTCQSLNGGSVPSPSNYMLDSLTTLLAYKMQNFELDPNAVHNFCDYNGQNCLSLNMISGHRDAYPTACPGDLTYNILSTIRSDVQTKKSTLTWGYSSRQLDFPSVSIDDNGSSTVTLSFKNTGTATWINTGANKIVLKTANSSFHPSSFSSNSWINSSTAAVLNEASVGPGEAGTFTITFSNSNGLTGDYYEYFQLVSENNWTFKNYFAVPIIINIVNFTPIPTPSLSPTPTVTSSPTPIVNKFKGDLDGNNKVDITDLSICALNYGKTTTSGDVNGDGKVDISDLSIIALNWGKSF